MTVYITIGVFVIAVVIALLLSDDNTPKPSGQGGC